MKNKLLLNLITISFLVMLYSCSKNDDSSSSTTPTPTPSTGLLTAKINGTAWAPSADSATASLMNGIINITGVARDGKTITITLNDTLPGIHDLGNAAINAGVYQVSPGASSSYNSNFGPWTGATNTLNITSIDKTHKKMSGTFAFKAFDFTIDDTASITEGSFNSLPYVTSIASTGSNIFNVDIDGVAFHSTLIAGVTASSKINIVASANSGTQSVGLYVPDNVIPGTYSLIAFGTYDAQYNPNSSTYLAVSSGTVTITEHNTVTHKIVGTFNFTATEFPTGSITAALTNGSFTIFY